MVAKEEIFLNVKFSNNFQIQTRVMGVRYVRLL